MRGHTNKATINQRRPMTSLMVELLTAMALPGVLIPDWKMSGKEKNVMRGLLDRGYATWRIETRNYAITDAGRAALTSQDHQSTHHQQEK